MEIVIKKLGLAGYVKANGGLLIKVENREFYFKSDISAREWGVKYSNSCCFRHDIEVCELRRFLVED